MFKPQKLCLAVHTSNAIPGLDNLGHGHDLNTFDLLLGPSSFKSLYALI